MADELMGEVARILDAVEVDESVRYWTLFWGHKLTDADDARLDDLISAGFQLPCGRHRDHNFDVAIHPTHITVENLECYPAWELELLGRAVAEVIASRVHTIPMVGWAGRWDLYGFPVTSS